MRVHRVFGVLLPSVVLACTGAAVAASPSHSPRAVHAAASMPRAETVTTAGVDSGWDDARPSPGLSVRDRAHDGASLPLRGPHGDDAGRYQAVRIGSASGWVILDTETGIFEHWEPVAGTSRYRVFRCRFGGDCPWSDKRSVDRGMDP